MCRRIEDNAFLSQQWFDFDCEPQWDVANVIQWKWWEYTLMTCDRTIDDCEDSGDSIVSRKARRRRMQTYLSFFLKISFICVG